MWVEINPQLLLLLRRELLDGFEDLLISEFNFRHELFSLLCFRSRSPSASITVHYGFVRIAAVSVSIKAWCSADARPFCNSAKTWARSPLRSAGTAKRRPGKVWLRITPSISASTVTYCPFSSRNQSICRSYTRHTTY